jgi:L-ribulokinase
MAHLKQEVYRPVPEHQAVYELLFFEYLGLHDFFGRGGNDVMKRLKKLRARQKQNLAAVTPS